MSYLVGILLSPMVGYVRGLDIELGVGIWNIEWVSVIVPTFRLFFRDLAQQL